MQSWNTAQAVFQTPGNPPDSDSRMLGSQARTAVPGIDSILLTDGNTVAHRLVRLFAQGCTAGPSNGLGGASRHRATDSNNREMSLFFSQWHPLKQLSYSRRLALRILALQLNIFLAISKINNSRNIIHLITGGVHAMGTDALEWERREGWSWTSQHAPGTSRRMALWQQGLAWAVWTQIPSSNASAWENSDTLRGPNGFSAPGAPGCQERVLRRISPAHWGLNTKDAKHRLKLDFLH